MRTLVLIILTLVLLTGCAAEETFETVADIWVDQPLPPPASIAVSLPGETALPAMEQDSARVYICNEYEVYLNTVEAGDLDNTVREMSGYPMEQLTVMSTTQQGADRYEFVWACAGETGDWLGRGVILDDGNYHYTMAVLRSADSVETSQVVWDGVFSSFHID